MSAASRDRTRSLSSFRVRYAETDQMGVVYHANYLVWAEVGRTDFIRRLGSTYAELERGGVRLAVVEASLRYLAGAAYDDLVEVETRLVEARSRSITFAYDIRRRDDGGGTTALARVTTRLVALDREGRPRTLPPELLVVLRTAAAPSEAH